MKRVLLLTLLIITLLFSSSNKAVASHLLGGEITWECLNTGEFVFTLTLYRACYSGAAGLGGSNNINNPLFAQYGGLSTIPVIRTTSFGIDLNETKHCYDSNLVFKCGQPITSGPALPMEKHVYKSAPVQLNGIPDSAGSNFFWSSCCRPTLLNSNGSGYYIRAVMFPYFNPTTNQVMYLGSKSGPPTCYDSSPIFAEDPVVAYCGKQMNQINRSTYDYDYDSTTYNWSNPMQSHTNPVSWKLGYNDTLQLPNTNHGLLNVGPNFDKTQGLIDFNTDTPLVSGYYFCTSKAVSYKNGQKVAEIFRDVPVQIINCLSPGSNPNAPSISVKKAGAAIYHSSFNDTVFIGSTIHLNIKLEDFDSLLTSPVTAQSVKLRITGDAMSSQVNNTSMCRIQPCAYLDSNNINWNFKKQVFEDTSTITVDFIWNTECSNLTSFQPNFQSDSIRTYHFLIEATDNYCPIPARKTLPIFITVIDTNASKSWTFESLDGRLPGTELKWPIYTKANFNSYELFSSENKGMPWVFLTSIVNNNTTTYIDRGTLTDQKSLRYLIRINSGISCDTGFVFKNIHLSIMNRPFFPELSWLYPFDQNTFRTGSYKVYRSINNAPWTLAYQTIFGNNKNGSFQDNNINLPLGSIVKYKVEALDVNNVLFISNIDSVYIDPAIWDGLKESNLDNIRLYPNPVNNVLHIQGIVNPAEVGVTIYSINGSKRLSGKIIQNNSIDVSALKSGMYFIQIEDEFGHRVQKKFIKQ